MNTAQQIDPVIGRLESILERGDLPPPYDRWGTRLLRHLAKPVQVVVTGFEGSGKSALVEMMSAQPVIGDAVRAPVVELTWGESKRVLIERDDGSIATEAGFLKDCDCPANAVRARQELPDNRLIQHNFIEIALRGSPAHKQSILESAIARADVMIWCSQQFGDEEQQLWSMVPDHIKDHSALVLTMADRQLMRGVLSDTIARLEPIVTEEFLGLFPVATIQGITAQTAAQDVNDALWASSGGKHLMELVVRQIKQGRTADVDQARIFLDRLAMRLPQLFAEATDLPKDDAPAEVTADPEPISPESVVAAPVTHGTSAAAVLSEAIDALQWHANQMLDEMGESGEVDADRILNGCSDAIMSVAGLLDAAEGADPATDALREDVQEGDEMLMLFQLERGEEAALDAATLLLQIRKEMIDKLAG